MKTKEFEARKASLCSGQVTGEWLTTSAVAACVCYKKEHVPRWLWENWLPTIRPRPGSIAWRIIYACSAWSSRDFLYKFWAYHTSCARAHQKILWWRGTVYRRELTRRKGTPSGKGNAEIVPPNDDRTRRSRNCPPPVEGPGYQKAAAEKFVSSRRRRRGKVDVQYCRVCRREDRQDSHGPRDRGRL